MQSEQPDNAAIILHYPQGSTSTTSLEDSKAAFFKLTQTNNTPFQSQRKAVWMPLSEHKLAPRPS